MSKHLVVRVDVVDLDERYGDLPESYDDALGTYARPIPDYSEESIEAAVELLINSIEE